MELDLRKVRTLQLTKANVLSVISGYEIMCYFCKRAMKPKKLYSSPYREDKHPSFNVFKSNHKWLWKDFGSGEGGEAFDLVMKIYNCDFKTSLEIVNRELNLGFNTDQVHVDRLPIYFEPEVEESETEFTFVSREWNISDVDLWESYAVLIDTILRIFPKEFVPVKFFGGWNPDRKAPFTFYETKKEPIYAYLLNNRARFYRPNSKKPRYMGNKNSEDVFGLKQAIEYQDRNKDCFIVGGEKDTLVMWSADIPAICFNSETNLPDGQVLAELKDSYRNVYFLHDNDHAGRVSARKWSEHFTNAGLPIGFRLQPGLEGQDKSDIFKMDPDKAKDVILSLPRHQDPYEVWEEIYPKNNE